MTRHAKPTPLIGPGRALIGVLAVALTILVVLHVRSSNASVSNDEPTPSFGPTDSLIFPSFAQVAPATTPTPTPSAVHSPDADPGPSAAQVAAATAAVAALAGPVGAGGVSVSAIDLATGARFTWGATSGMYTGSVIKLDILETLLLQHEHTGEKLTDSLSQTATTMIENSSNDAAQDLWEAVGSNTGVAAANKTLGPTPHTVPGTDDYWGLTTTSASDQVTLLRNLVRPGPLDAASRAYALQLMRNVESDQRWGVGVIDTSGGGFANKNGWLSVDDDHGRWLVNSDGVLTVDGQQVLISVLTQHDASFQSGIDLVQALAKAMLPAIVKG